MSKIVMFTSASCPFCLNAEKLLNSKGVTDIEKIRIDLDPEQRDIMMAKLAVGLCRRFTLGIIM